jgi:hypothetical protein
MGAGPFPDDPTVQRIHRCWHLTHRARPWLLNSERAGSSRGIGGTFGRASLTTEWRNAFALLAAADKVPPLRWASIEVAQLCRDRRMPDIGNCSPAVKAAIDGLVDAGVLEDDSTGHIAHLDYLPPRVVGYDALTLKVAGPRCRLDERQEREEKVQARLVRQLARRR